MPDAVGDTMLMLSVVFPQRGEPAGVQLPLAGVDPRVVCARSLRGGREGRRLPRGLPQHAGRIVPERTHRKDLPGRVSWGARRGFLSAPASPG